MKEIKLLNDSISVLLEMLSSDEMTQIGRSQIRSVIEDLQNLQKQLAAERDEEKRRTMISRVVERVAAAVVRVLVGLD